MGGSHPIIRKAWRAKTEVSWVRNFTSSYLIVTLARIARLPYKFHTCRPLNYVSQLLNTHIHTQVTQSCLTFCSPMDCGLPCTSIPGVLQAKILEWVAIPGDLPDPGIEHGSPALQTDSLLCEPPVKPPITYMCIHTHTHTHTHISQGSVLYKSIRWYLCLSLYLSLLVFFP